MKLTFEEACFRYQDFLVANNYPREIVWVTPDDVLAAAPRVFSIRTPVSPDNAARARELFDAAMANQTGVSFSTLCEMDDATCCYVWTPTNEEERLRAMCPKDLKLSALSGQSRMRGKRINNPWLWKYLSFRHRGQRKTLRELFWG